MPAESIAILERLCNATTIVAARIRPSLIQLSGDSNSDKHVRRPSPPDLPLPPSLHERIVEFSLSDESKRRLSEVYDGQCVKLRQAALRNWNSLTSGLCSIHSQRSSSLDVEALLQKCAKLSRDKYLSGLAECTDNAIRTARELHESGKLMAIQTANIGELHEQHRIQIASRPLLEQFFKQNAFPSRVDKQSLARKTGMSYRQIHVWFQNRRARAKRDNECLIQVAPKQSPLYIADKCGNLPEYHPLSSQTETVGFRQVARAMTNDNHFPDELASDCEEIVSTLDLDASENITSMQHPGSSHDLVCALKPERSSSIGIFYRHKLKPARRLESQYYDITSLNNSFLTMIYTQDETSPIQSSAQLDGYQLLSESNHQSYFTDNGRRRRYVAPQTVCSHVSPITTSRSFSQAFESQEESTLASSEDQQLSSPVKRRRIMNPASETTSSLMSLAQVCLAASHKKVATLPKCLLASSIPHRTLNSPISPASISVSPLSTTSSLPSPSPPVSSPPHTPSSASDSDHLFSESSVSDISEPSTPTSSIIALPSSCPSPDGRDSFSSVFTSENDLLSIGSEAYIRSRVSSDRSTCFLPPSSSQPVPQVVRRMAPYSQHFISSAAGNMLQLNF